MSNFLTCFLTTIIQARQILDLEFMLTAIKQIPPAENFTASDTVPFLRKYPWLIETILRPIYELIGKDEPEKMSSMYTAVENHLMKAYLSDLQFQIRSSLKYLQNSIDPKLDIIILCHLKSSKT